MTRCVTPLSDTEGKTLDEIETCGKAATTTRVVDGIVMPLCAEHAAELDEEAHTAQTR